MVFDQFKSLISAFEVIRIAILFGSIGIMAASCQNHDVNCTEEFRMIGMIVTRDSLTDFYTVRVSVSDTIRFQGNIGYPENNWYPVLDDNYQSKISGSQDTFRFIGETNDTIVVDENFVIKADACHISKVSGADSIILQ
jgi:hypothetical protein